MKLPFSAEAFFEVFRAYNETVWPSQIFLACLALTIVCLILRPRGWGGAFISASLSFLWAWMAIAYHLAFFLEINRLAMVFAAFSLAGAAVFFWQGVVKRRLDFRWGGGVRSVAGLVLIVFSLAIYPIWSIGSGHSYPQLPTFGLPCPTTIFTIGILAFAVAPYPRGPLVVPVLWCLVGTQAAFLLGVHQDLGLILAGVVGVGLLFGAEP